MTGPATIGQTDTWRTPLYPRTTDLGDAYTLYCAHLQQRYRHLPGTHIGHPDSVVERRDITVASMLASRRAGHDDDDDELATGARDILFWLQQFPFLVVSGAPGSGKTWLVDRLVDDLSARISNAFAQALPDHLPIPLPTRELARACCSRDREPDDTDGRRPARDLDDVIQDWFTHTVGIDPERLQPFFDQGRYIILIDGLDAVAIDERRRIWQWLAVHQTRHAGRGYYVVTSRPAGMRGLPAPTTPSDDLSAPSRISLPMLGQPPPMPARTSRPDSPGPGPTALVVHLRPLTERRAALLYARIRVAQGASPEHASRAAERLTAMARDDDDIRDLLRRPGWCRLLATTRDALSPNGSRVALYRRALDDYCRMSLTPGVPARAHAEHATLLGMLAYLAGAESDDDEPDTVTWSRAYLRLLTRRLLTRDEFRDLTPEHADGLLDSWLRTPLVLGETEDGEVCFTEPSLREYLAATHLYAQAISVADKRRYIAEHALAHLGTTSGDEIATWIFAIDADITGGRGHRLLLSAVDITQETDAMWLTELLGGNDVPFSAHERFAWLGGLLAAAMVFNWRDLGDALAHHRGNRSAVARLVEQAAIPWLERKWPRLRIRRALERPDAGDTRDRTTEESLAAEPLGTLVHARRTVLDHNALWRIDGHWDLARAERELATIAYMAGDADVRLDDEQLVLLLPPQLFTCTSEGLLASESFWALQGLARPDTPLFSRALRARANPGAWVTLDETCAPAWPLGRPSAAEIDIREALETALLVAASAPDVTLVEAWLLARARAVALAVAGTHIPGRQQALARAKNAMNAHAATQDDVLQRARALARAIPLSLALAHSQTLARERAGALARSRVGALARALLGANTLVAMRTLATALVRALGRNLAVDAESKLWSIVIRFGLLAEALLMMPPSRPRLDAPLSRERVTRAAARLCDGAWLDRHDDGDRLCREFAESHALGLFPSRLLIVASGPDSWLTDDALRPRDTLDRLAAELASLRTIS